MPLESTARLIVLPDRFFDGAADTRQSGMTVGIAGKHITAARRAITKFHGFPQANFTTDEAARSTSSVCAIRPAATLHMATTTPASAIDFGDALGAIRAGVWAGLTLMGKVLRAAEKETING